MKRIVGLGAIVTLFGCALAGCSWDNPLYDAFVGTESKGGLVRCEGMKSLQLRPSAGDAQVVSIALAAECKSHAAELKTLGLSVATCEQSLVSEICPKNYSCYSGTCALMICNANEVFCDEHCVNPLTDSTFCGASGSCSALEDTRGTDCRAQETGQSCQNGRVQEKCVRGSDAGIVRGGGSQCMRAHIRGRGRPLRGLQLPLCRAPDEPRDGESMCGRQVPI